MQTWFLFALVAAVSFAAYSVLLRLFLRERGDAQVFALLADAAVAVVLLLVSPLDRHMVALAPRHLVLIGLAGGLYAASSLLLFWGRQLEEVSRVSLARETSVLWIFLGGVLVLGEAVSLPKALGLVLILGGAVLALWQGTAWRLSRGLLLVLVGALLGGASSLIGKTIVEDNLSPALYVSTISGLAALVLFTVLPHRVERIAAELRQQHLRVLVIGVVLGLSVLFLMKAYQVGEASRAGPVYGSSLILAVLAGIIVLGERKNLRLKLFGTGLAFGGVLLLR